MAKRSSYPTWKRISSSLLVSEEQRDGTPDFYLQKWPKRDCRDPSRRWYVKWRTSACWAGPYATAAEAMKHTQDSAAGNKFA